LLYLCICGTHERISSMTSRNLVAGVVACAILLVGGFSLSQERMPAPKVRPRAPRTAEDRLVARTVEDRRATRTVEDRVAELERQVSSLTQQLDSLRKETHPAAVQSPRPRPLSQGYFR